MMGSVVFSFELVNGICDMSTLRGLLKALLHEVAMLDDKNGLLSWPSSAQPCLDGILPSSVSNLRGDYHNPLPAKLVHT